MPMSAPPAASEIADIMLIGGNVITLDRTQSIGSAVALRGGTISAVGNETDVRPLRGQHTEVVDLHGATVIPGLVDGHSHPLFGLDLTRGVDLSGCSSLEQVRAALAGQDPADDGGWVLGWGMDPNAFGTTPISAAAVEEAVGQAPMFLRLFDGHAALASHSALSAAGVMRARIFDQKAEIVCDPHGLPTGHLLEPAAMDLVGSIVPPVPTELQPGRLRSLMQTMAAAGLTGAQAMDCAGDGLELLAALERTAPLDLRLRLAPWCMPDAGDEGLRGLLELQQRSGQRWRVAAVKFFIDGTIDGGTAWLDEPDLHGESIQPFWPDPAAYTEAVRFFAERHVQTVTHAIGDAAVRHVLDTLQQVTPADSRVRHRIEHLETLPSELIPRFADLGVVASMQPTHCTNYTRADHSDNWSRRLGEVRASRAWRCRDIYDSGAVLVLGSDWPIAPYDPLEILAAAQLRRRPAHPDEPPIQARQALSPLAALEGYTTAPAAASGEQDQFGRIIVGHRADLTVLGGDPLRVPATDLAQVPVLATFVDGTFAYRSAELDRQSE